MICEHCGTELGESFLEQQERSGIKHSHPNLPGRCTERCPAFRVNIIERRPHSDTMCCDILVTKLAKLQDENARLRKALEEIALYEPGRRCWLLTDAKPLEWDIARQALATTDQPKEKP